MVELTPSEHAKKAARDPKQSCGEVAVARKLLDKGPIVTCIGLTDFGMPERRSVVEAICDRDLGQTIIYIKDARL